MHFSQVASRVMKGMTLVMIAASATNVTETGIINMNAAKTVINRVAITTIRER
jgi:hypothetical protein